MNNKFNGIASEMLKEAWISIKSYKLRSSLTIAGIVIGIASVVLMVSIGEGVQKQIDEQFSNLGSNLITIRPGSPKTRGVSSGNFQTLTYEDAAAIANLNFIDKVSYTKNASGQAVYGSNNYSVTIYGTTTKYFESMNLKIDKGNFFNEKDEKSGSPFIVIGKNVADQLYPNENAVGKIIRIKNIPLKVVGVLKEQGSSFGPSIDDSVFIPFKTFLRRVSGSKYPKVVSQISINVSDQIYIDYAQVKITELLRKRHFIKPNQDDDFRINNLKDIADSIKGTTEVFSLLLASIASISLVVGSIGIVNMMLVSVTERTREIGLRKAIGAREKTIMQQFLLEALMISFLGSFIGLLIGLVLSQIAELIIKINLPISIYAIILSIVVSILVGILSGLAPAIKASKLNPIDALRYE
ncbi:MAG: ABC transporter permease [Pseudomonadota bacterium]